MRIPHPRQATDRFLDALAPWTHFITATHRIPGSVDRSVRTLRDWAEALAREVEDHVHILWGAGRGGQFGRAHWHALVAPWRANVSIPAELLEQLWTDGQIQVQGYIRGLRAPSYITRHERTNYGVVCPHIECRRHCVGGPHPFF